MIPEFDIFGNLPAGEHQVTWQELLDRYSYTPWRRHLLDGLLNALQLLRAAGCRRAYVDGSFVTAKDEPGDFDACWDAEGVDFDLVDERLLTFDEGRATQKAAFAGELFSLPISAPIRRARCSGTFSKPTAMGAVRASSLWI